MGRDVAIGAGGTKVGFLAARPSKREICNVASLISSDSWRPGIGFLLRR